MTGDRGVGLGNGMFAKFDSGTVTLRAYRPCLSGFHPIYRTRRYPRRKGLTTMKTLTTLLAVAFLAAVSIPATAATKQMVSTTRDNIKHPSAAAKDPRSDAFLPKRHTTNPHTRSKDRGLFDKTYQPNKPKAEPRGFRR